MRQAGAGGGSLVKDGPPSAYRGVSKRPLVIVLQGQGGRKNASGKSVSTSGKLVANTPGKVVANDNEEDVGVVVVEEDDDEVGMLQGWRLEKNSNGFWRWRYQRTDAGGNPLTYVNKSGNTGYRRGSKYIGKLK